MRATTRATVEHYLDQLDLKGDVLEIGGFTLSKCAIDVFPAPRFRYRDLDIESVDIPDTIVADITDCRAEIPDESFDVVLSCDVFEHIDRPWLAAAEIARILRPGGIAITRTVWAWRNHPCPIDYWRFSPECLEFLFAPLECLEKGYDLSERRRDYPGFWPNGNDSVPVDAIGGFRENWAVYSVHRKGGGPAVAPFKSTAHPQARHLQQDTQGTVTNRAMLGLPKSPDPLDFADRLRAVETRLDRIGERVGAVDGMQKELRALRRDLAGNAPLSARAYRRLRRQWANRAKAR